MQSQNTGQQTSSYGSHYLGEEQNIPKATLWKPENNYVTCFRWLCALLWLMKVVRAWLLHWNVCSSLVRLCYSESSCNCIVIYIFVGKMVTHLKFGSGLSSVCLVLMRSSEHFVGRQVFEMKSWWGWLKWDAWCFLKLFPYSNIFWILLEHQLQGWRY